MIKWFGTYLVLIRIFCFRFVVGELADEVGKIISFCVDLGSCTKCFNCCEFAELNSWKGELLVLFETITELAEVDVDGLFGALVQPLCAELTLLLFY